MKDLMYAEGNTISIGKLVHCEKTMHSLCTKYQ